MKIGINGYEAVVPRFGYDKKTGLPNRVGSGEFCFQLLSALSRTDKINQYSIFLPLRPASDMPRETDKWRYVTFHSKKLWTLLGLSNKLRSYKQDVFFSPTHYLPPFTGAPSVIAILDVSYLYFPELFKRKDLNQLKFWGGYSIRKAKKIITISNSSKSDIIKMYGKKAEDIVVAYPGIKMDKISSKPLDLRKFEVEGEFILFVGTLQPRKNLVKLIEAFSKLDKKSLKLVVIGKKGWNFEEILLAPKKFGVEDKVLFLDSVSDEELPSFYTNALCFVLPSLYEGFGLPVLEAMKYGCPVLTSNISSLPEAGGDAALYFNPEDVSDITGKINQVVSSLPLRDEMIKKGYNQIKKFSWEKTAKETLKVLEELGNAR